MASEIVVNEFIAEAREHLSNAEFDLLAMENCLECEFSEIVDRLFRTIHSIKGSIRDVRVSSRNGAEPCDGKCTALFRDGRANADHGKINDLLNGVDKLKCMIDDIYSSTKSTAAMSSKG